MQQIGTHTTSVELVPAAVPARTTTPLGRCIIAADRGIYRVANHWVLAVNALFALHLTSILLAPVLVAAGLSGLARPIYAYNGLFCHQDADRSFHLLGYKLAVCERCVAIYAALLVFGLVFAFLRGRLRAPYLYEVALLSLPMAVDGIGQLVGAWESTAATRVLTGAMFGFVACWWLMPWLDGGFTRIRIQIEALFTRLVAEGRARPL